VIDTNKITETAFRTRYAVPASVQILGWSFNLGNAGEALRLEKPNPDPSTPDILVEKVRYNDRSPWPTEADGEGPSLERFVADAYGNDPINWRTSTPGGSPGRTNVFVSGIAVARQSNWKYYATPSTLGDAWKGSAYADSGWPDGDGPLGYGEQFIRTSVPYGNDPTNRYPTTYLRKDFVIPDDLNSITGLVMNVLYDDGFLVSLNGTEITRRGLDAGPVGYADLADTRTLPESAGTIRLPVRLHPASSNNVSVGFVDTGGTATRGLDYALTNTLLVFSPGDVTQFVETAVIDDTVYERMEWVTLLLTNATNAQVGLSAETQLWLYDGEDADGDDLPDDWESSTGLAPQSAEGDVGRDGDPDRDGMTNWEEFKADTHPSNSASLLAVLDLDSVSNGIEVTWQGGNAVTQYLEQASSLIGSSWTTVYTNRPPTAETNTYVHPRGTPSKCFYRIRTGSS